MRVVIVGGGISGLSAAYYLAKHGIASTLIEREGRLGGVISTERREGCVLEAGPDSYLAQKPWALHLIRELGLGGDVIGSNDHLRVTYVLKRGRLVPLPDGLMLMIPTRIFPLVRTSLLGLETKIRMGLEWFRRPRDGWQPDRSVAEFVEIERKYGSLTKGVLHERRKAAKHAQGQPLFQTLKGGLGQLVESLITQTRPAPEVLHASAEAVERSAGGSSWRVRAGGEWIEADHVVLACQAYQAAALVGSVDGELVALLDSIPYSNSITISLVYDKAGFRHPLNGFGFLVPKSERQLLVACTWVGTKFSDRVPPDKVVLRCFVGGEDPGVLALSDQDLVTHVRAELLTVMGVSATPAFTHIARWPRSMAQYTVGHGDRVARIEARLKELGGLHVAGNAYHGIGIPDCVRMGKQAADAVAAHSSGWAART